MKRIIITGALIVVQVPSALMAQKDEIPEERISIQRYGDLGYWQQIYEPEIIEAQISVYEKRMRSLGIPAKVQSCRLVSQIARGVANGAFATGALCSISIGAKPKREFWVCENSHGSFNISDNKEYGLTYETSKEFIGSTCWMF